MDFGLKVHDTEKGRVVAACDRDIVGQTFSGDNTTITVNRTFYVDDYVDLEDVIAALDRYVTANLVGNQLLAALIDHGIVDAAEPRTVGTVQHVQLFRL